MSRDSEINEISIMMNDTGWHDIDGGLAADFDGSLSGLGVELGANAYNMSEALLALPVFKQEHIDDLSKLNSSTDNTMRNATSSVFQQVVAYGSRFQYIMSAATSPATKMNEETVTYLNQGQSYEVKIKKLGDLSDSKGQYYRSVIRVTFHDRRLQFTEKEQLETWKQTRPGDRILDIDIPLSYGAVDMKVDPSILNAAEFIWDPSVDTGIFVRVHCISTEFTAKKHGGEKGVPFRVQVDTYTHPQDGSLSELIHSASSQIKVFKPKGADRKHKTDRDKIEKINENEKKNYQPSYECTVLTEIPPDQMLSLKTTVNTVNPTTTATTTSTTLHTSTTEKRKWSPKVRTNRTPRKRSVSSPNNWATSRTSPTSSVGMPSPSPSPNSDTSSVISHTRLDADLNLLDSGEFSPLAPDASANQVSEWLHQNRFFNFSRIFQNFSGADLLRLSRDDLIQICGLADGIRLNNALQSKIIRPKLTLFVSQEGEQVYHALYLELLDYSEIVSKLAALYNLPAEKIADVYLQGPSGIHILVTDEVIQNITDQSRFSVDALNDQSNDTYRILLKTVD